MSLIAKSPFENMCANFGGRGAKSRSFDGASEKTNYVFYTGEILGFTLEKNLPTAGKLAMSEVFKS